MASSEAPVLSRFAPETTAGLGPWPSGCCSPTLLTLTEGSLGCLSACKKACPCSSHASGCQVLGLGRVEARCLPSPVSVSSHLQAHPTHPPHWNDYQQEGSSYTQSCRTQKHPSCPACSLSQAKPKEWVPPGVPRDADMQILLLSINHLSASVRAGALI